MEAHLHPTISPLQLNRYFIKKLDFRLNESFDRRGRPTAKEIRSTVMPPMGVDVVAEQNPDNERQWRLELNIELTDSVDFPYRVSLILVGYFTVNSKLPMPEASDLARISGSSVLYSAAREVIVNITGRTHYPHLLLPTVSFFDLPREAVAAKRLGALAQSKTSAKKAASKRRPAKIAAKKK